MKNAKKEKHHWVPLEQRYTRLYYIQLLIVQLSGIFQRALSIILDFKYYTPFSIIHQL